MFENYKTMSDAEKASVKAIHKALRAGTGDRYGNLAWAYVRGFPYRRVERTTRDDNKPQAGFITHLLGKAGVPGFPTPRGGASWWETEASPAVIAWLLDPSGAIPVPVRPRLTPAEARALHESRKKVA